MRLAPRLFDRVAGFPRHHRAVHLHRQFDVLQAGLSQAGEADIDFVAHLVEDDLTDAHAARYGQWLDARGEIDAVAVNVAPAGHDVADMDADAQAHVPRCWQRL